MINFKYMLRFILILIFFSKTIFATGLLNPYSGMDGMPLLQIPFDSRANGMAGALSAGCEDAASLSINPAGLAKLKTFELNFVYFDWLADTSIQSLTWAQPLSKINMIRDSLIQLFNSDKVYSFLKSMWEGNFAANIVWLYVPSMINYDNYGYESGTVSFKSMIFSLAYAKTFGKWDLGTKLSYAYQGINHGFKHSFGIDLGFQTYTPEVIIPLWLNKKWIISPLSYGFSIRNIAISEKNNTVCWNLQGGIKVPVINSFYFTVDIQKELYRFMSFFNLDWQVMLGAEYLFRNILFVRTGLRIGKDLNFFSAGIGVHYRFKDIDAKLDYVCMPTSRIEPALNNLSFDTKFETFTKKEEEITDNRKKLLETFYFKGLAHYANNEFDQAIAQWEEALKLDPANKVILKAIKEAKERKLKFEELRKNKKTDELDSENKKTDN